MSWKSLLCAGLLCVFASPAFAAPSVTMALGGMNGANQLWNVSVTPDVATFEANDVLAVELDFDFSGDILGATLNNTFWNLAGANPGNNPFTGTVTEGIQLNLANDTLFVSAGSELFATATPALLMTIETMGTGGTFNWGGLNVTPPMGASYMSSRIAQDGVNFNGITGTFSPVAPCIDGDFDCSGGVGNSDLTLLLNSWGDPVPPTPGGWTGTPPTAPGIGNDELTLLLNNWGNVAGAGVGSVASAAVPEPGSFVLAVLAMVTLGLVRRR